MNKAILIALSLITASTAMPERLYLFGSSEILWDDDFIGIPGGYPGDGWAQHSNLIDLGCDPTGAVDCSAILDAALAACPANQYVYAPAGRYLVNSSITESKDNIELRGEVGPDGELLTTFEGKGTIQFGTGSNPLPTTGDGGFWEIVSGATAGSSNVVLAGTTSVSANSFGEFRAFGADTNAWMKQHTPFLDTTATGGDPGFNANRIGLLSQFVHITAVNTTTKEVTFWPPLVADFSNNGAMASWPSTITENVGFRDFKITAADEDGNVSSTQLNLLGFTHCYGFWVTNVWVYKNPRRGILVQKSVGGEIMGSFASESANSTVPGPNGECFDLFRDVTGVRMENNRFWNQYPAICLADAGWGVNLNFIAYNFVDGDVAGASADILVNHGYGTSYNLIEGNIVSGKIKIDSYFGPSQNNTVYRNFAWGEDDWAFQADRWSLSNNVAGNVFGTNSLTWNRYDATGAFDANRSIYRIGFPNIGNSFVEFSTNAAWNYPGTQDENGVVYSPATLTADAVATTTLQGDFTDYESGEWIAIQDPSDTNIYIYTTTTGAGTATDITVSEVSYRNRDESNPIGQITMAAGALVYKTDNSFWQVYREEVRASIIRSGNYDAFTQSIDSDAQWDDFPRSLFVPYQTSLPAYYAGVDTNIYRYPPIMPTEETMVVNNIAAAIYYGEDVYGGDEGGGETAPKMRISGGVTMNGARLN